MFCNTKDLFCRSTLTCEQVQHGKTRMLATWIAQALAPALSVSPDLQIFSTRMLVSCQADGRAFYKSEEAHPAPAAPGSQTPWFFTPINQLHGWFQPAEWHHTYLYYNGLADSTSALGEWHFLYSNHSHGKKIAKLFVTRPSGQPVAVNVAPGPPHALPPRRATWNVLCDSTTLNTSMWIAKELKFRAQGKGIDTNLTGHWEYVSMVMRGSATLEENKIRQLFLIHSTKLRSLLRNLVAFCT